MEDIYRYALWIFHKALTLCCSLSCHEHTHSMTGAGCDDVLIFFGWNSLVGIARLFNKIQAA